jgi:TonB-linked SusC/RagA family outer membrane protein
MTKKRKAKKCSLFLLMFLFCSAFAMNAQIKSISGIVTEAATGEAIIGASVHIKGTSAGTSTDVDGKFKLNVPENGKILVVEYLGYTTQEFPIDRETYDVSMREAVNELEEFVVVGYGTVKKKDLTGSISTLKADALASVPIANSMEAMSGRLAGVRVTTTDGSPDAEMIIRVRGGGSITQSNTPLYIVDGFTVSSFSDIPVNDIETFTVLKDASSTAIYGAQGANGVVLVTTKRGSTGRVKVSYNGFMESKQLARRLTVLDPYDYVMWNYELAAIEGESAIASFEKKFGVYDDLDLYKYQKGTDWQDDMFGSNLVSQQHNISIAGGTDNTNYLLSGTYNFDGGLLPNTDYGRYNLNFKLDQDLSKTLKFKFSARATDTKINGDGTSGGTNKIRTQDALTKGPVGGLSDFVTVDPNTLSEDEYDDWVRSNMSLAEQASQYWRRRYQKSLNLDGSLEWKIIKGLSYRVESGIVYGFNETQNYKGYTTVDASNNGGKPLISWNKQNTNRWKIANILNYQFKLLDSNTFQFMLGQESSSSDNNSNTMDVKGFNKDLTPEKIFANVGLGDGGSSVSSSQSEPVRLLSYFGRFGYDYKDRYRLTATLRADGSSKFMEGHQWGYFPSAAFAWRVSEEPFMQGTKEWINDLKFRISYGEAGNNNISSGLFKSDYSISSSGTYALGDQANNYYTSGSRLPNPEIRWESMITKNIGMDFSLFGQKLSGTVEYYHNTSKDLLLDVKITAPGYTSTMKNIGQTTNKGVEVTLNAYDIVKTKNFVLNADFNIGFNKGNVDALDTDGNFLPYGTNWASTDLKGLSEYEIHVGQPVGMIYGWITDGYYTTDDFSEYDSAAKKYILKDGQPTTGLLGGRIGIRPGTIKFKDISGPDGEPDGVVDDYDRTIIGNANPDFSGGFGFNGYIFKNFDYTLFFSFVYGNDIYNATKLASSQQYRTSYPNLRGFWTTDNRYTYLAEDGTIVTDLATLAAMNEGANAKQYWSPLSFGNSNAVIHSWAIEDGSFLRLQNVTLGYTLPAKLSRKLACERLRLYTTLKNVWVWTNYSGYDPEVSSPGRGSTSTQLIPGLDYSGYPKSFSWTLGLNITF